MALYGKSVTLTAPSGANIWPGITEATAREFVRVGRGQPIAAPNTFAQLHVRYYHQQAYGESGTTLLTFFNVPAAEHVCNLGNGLAPDERPFWCTGISITASDLTAAGAKSGSIVSTVATGVTVDAATRANDWRQVLSSGLLQFYVADRLIHEGQGLDKYPTGGGLHMDGAGLSTTNTTTNAVLTNWTNGVPHAGNLFKFPRPYPVLPGKSCRVLLKWQAAVSLSAPSTTPGRIRVELIGESVAPLNQ